LCEKFLTRTKGVQSRREKREGSEQKGEVFLLKKVLLGVTAP
jgi:hypothetical protein